MEDVEPGHGQDVLRAAQGPEGFRGRLVRRHRLGLAALGGPEDPPRVVPDGVQEPGGPFSRQGFRKRGPVRRQVGQLQHPMLAEHVRRLGFGLRLRLLLFRLLHHQVDRRVLRPGGLLRIGLRLGRRGQIHPAQEGQVQIDAAVVGVHNILLRENGRAGRNQNDNQQNDGRPRARRMPAPVVLISLCHGCSSFLSCRSGETAGFLSSTIPHLPGNMQPDFGKNDKILEPGYFRLHNRGKVCYTAFQQKLPLEENAHD